MFKYVFAQSTTAGFGAVMAAEREQKLRSQRTHDDHTMKTVNHDLTHSPKFPKKQPSTGRQSPKDTVPVVKEKQLVMARKRVKQGVCM